MSQRKKDRIQIKKRFYIILLIIAVAVTAIVATVTGCYGNDSGDPAASTTTDETVPDGNDPADTTGITAEGTSEDSSSGTSEVSSENTAEETGGDTTETVTETTIEGTSENTSEETDGSVTESVSNTDNGNNSDYTQIKPDESGKVMVVMFHNFIKTYKGGDKYYTTTFDDFRKLLQNLYDNDYRLVNLLDFINGDISVPAGTIPIVFTFDDGTAGQFSLIEQDGDLRVNPDSAVGIMQEFAETHPDFGLKGTFYINLGASVFPGKGTVAQRLQYLIDEGFEIGNHTYTHIHLNEAESAEEIQREIGANQKKMYELIPGYLIKSLSLPYGQPAENLIGYVEKGKYGGVEYHNIAICEVGWDPSVSPIHLKFNPLTLHRVRSTGITNVEADLAWWLDKLKRSDQFVSDGDASTIVIPETRLQSLDKSKLGDKKLIIY